MPKISVIIPIFNAKDFIARCLDSIVNQTLKDIEIICVDDCSTDCSLDIIKSYAKNDNRFKIIHLDVNCGESKARNIGLDNVTGEYIAFVDNDDALDINFFEVLHNNAIENNADISKGEVRVHDYDGKITYGEINKKMKKYNSNLFFAYFWWTAIFKTSLVRNNNIYFLEGYPLGGDVLFLNQVILKATKVVTTDNTFYNYYRRENSGDSKILTMEKIKSAVDIQEKILDNTIDASIEDSTGINYIKLWSLENTIGFVYRNFCYENIVYCVNKLFDFYNKISGNVVIDKTNIPMTVVFEYLKKNDKDGLINFYLKNNTRKKMFLTMLRYKHIKVNSNV